MDELMIKIDNVCKEYRLGTIGGGTLQADLQSWWAKKHGKEDPNSKIGSKTYGKNETFMALNGVSFKVKKGERVGIIGHNGAGKSTLLKLLSRVTAPTSGTIGLNGRITSMLEVGTGFHGELTGRENVYMNGAILGMTKKEIDEKMEQIIEFSECGKFIDTPVKRYSSGMYVKLAFSVAAHLDSEIMIMDEVLAVGDMAFQKKCLDKMNDVSKTEGRTILYVSHNMNTIRQLCDRCIVLDHGKVIYDGNVEEAISVYLGVNHSFQTFTDCTQVPHESIGDGKVFLKSVELLEVTEPVIYDNNPLKIRLIFDSNCAYDTLSFRAIIFSSQQTPVGMTAAESCFSAQKGENQIEADVYLEHLAPGDYNVRLAFYEINEFGGETLHDVIDKAFSFRKELKDGILDTTKIWKTRVWGNICFDKINVSNSK